jgi:hypothetical protein
MSERSLVPKTNDLTGDERHEIDRQEKTLEDYRAQLGTRI